MTDTSAEIREQIRRHVLDRLAPKGVSDVDNTESLVENGITDSLGIFRTIDFLEATFPIQIAPNEIAYENFRNIDTIVRFVESKQRGI